MELLSLEGPENNADQRIPASKSCGCSRMLGIEFMVGTAARLVRQKGTGEVSQPGSAGHRTAARPVKDLDRIHSIRPRQKETPPKPRQHFQV